MGRSWRVGFSLTIAIVVAGCSVGPWRKDQPLLYSPANGSVAVSQGGLRAGDRLSEGGVPLCLDVPGSVTVTRVETLGTWNGLYVDAFAVRTVAPGEVPVGGAAGGLDALGLTADEQTIRTVTNVCGAESRALVGLEGPPPAGSVEQRVDLVVAVSAHRPGGRPGVAHRLPRQQRRGGFDGLPVRHQHVRRGTRLRAGDQQLMGLHISWRVAQAGGRGGRG